MKIEISDKEYELILYSIAFMAAQHDTSHYGENIGIDILDLELSTGEKNLGEIEAYRQRKRDGK